MKGRMFETHGGRSVPYAFLFSLVLIVLPLFLSSYGVNLLTEVLIWSIFALSLNLLNGYLGLPSFGHAAFWGLGAYSVGILTIKLGIGIKGVHGLLLLLLSGVLTATIVGAIFGLLIVRLPADIFLMVTLALSQMLWGVAWRWRSLTGGDDGLSGIPRPDLGLPWTINDPRTFYLLTVIFFMGCAFLMYRIVKSPFGNVLVGIRENEARMRALGYNSWGYKYCTYILAALFGGVAGSLFALFNGFAAPSELSWFMSGTVMIMIMVGGLRHFCGPIVGVMVVLGLKYGLGRYTEHWPLVMGIIFVITVMYAREGISGYFARLMRKGRMREKYDGST